MAAIHFPVIAFDGETDELETMIERFKNAFTFPR